MDLPRGHRQGPLAMSGRPVVVALALAILLPRADSMAARFKIPGEAPALVSQAAPRWCWAATAEMLLGFQDPDKILDYEQLKVVNATPEGRTCAPERLGPCPPYVPDCAQLGGHVKPNLLCDTSSGDHCFTESDDTRKLSWGVAKQELDECRPFPVLFGDDQGGHWVLALRAFTGQAPGPQQEPVKFLLVRNPLPCCQGQTFALPFGAYEGGINGLPHWKTLKGIVRKPNPRVFNTPCTFGPGANDAKGNLPVVRGDLRQLAERAARSAFPDESSASWRALRGLPQAVPSIGLIAGWADDVDLDWRQAFPTNNRRQTLAIVSPGNRLEAAVVLRESWLDHWAVETIHDEEAAAQIFVPPVLAKPEDWRQIYFAETGASLLLRASAPGKLDDPNEPFHTTGYKCRKVEDSPMTARAALMDLSRL